MTIVYVDMVADLFHYGHVRFFKQALEYGDKLIVGLMSDKECEGYKRKPYLDILERKESVEACRYVDKVIINAPMPITKEFIEKYQIDIVCHGDDMKEEDVKYWYKAPLEMNKYRTTKYTKSISTSGIIRRVQER